MQNIILGRIVYFRSVLSADQAARAAMKDAMRDALYQSAANLVCVGIDTKSVNEQLLELLSNVEAIEIALPVRSLSGAAENPSANS